MSRLQDLKEQLLSRGQELWAQLQETSLYHQFKDRYENLTPPLQKLTLFTVATFFVLIFLSIPYGYFSSSSDLLSEFSERRQLMRELQQVTQEASAAPSLPVPPTLETLQTMIQSQLTAQRLLPEQILSTQSEAISTPLIPSQLIQNAVKIQLSKLNLRQIVDVGYQLQSISPSIKLKDISIEAAQEPGLDPGYFNVSYRLVTLAVPKKKINFDSSDDNKNTESKKGRFQRDRQ